jgi:hypothetical protein
MATGGSLCPHDSTAQHMHYMHAQATHAALACTVYMMLVLLPPTLLQDLQLADHGLVLWP